MTGQPKGRVGAKGAAAGVAALILATLTLASPQLRTFLDAWEGGKDASGGSRVYADKLAGGLPTVCNGLTRHVTRTPIVVGEYWPKEKCDREESAAIARLQTRLAHCFTRVPPQSVFDAASSHGWNFGDHKTCASAAMAAWNRGEWALGCRRIYLGDDGKRVWSYIKTGRTLPNGKPEMKFVRGLANRREEEYRLCLADLPSGSPLVANAP